MLINVLKFVLTSINTIYHFMAIFKESLCKIERQSDNLKHMPVYTPSTQVEDFEFPV